MRSEVLLPGYIFVITDQPGKLREALRSVPKFTRLLGNNDVFTPLDDQEVAFINAFTKPDHRVVEFSSGVMEGDEIVILNGPLMNQTGLIKKLDRHKRLAYLEIEILGRVKTVKVGLEIVRKKPLQINRRNRRRSRRAGRRLRNSGGARGDFHAPNV